MLSIIEKQIQRAIKKTNINEDLFLKILKSPMNKIEINFPVQLNDKIEIFSDIAFNTIIISVHLKGDTISSYCKY